MKVFTSIMRTKSLLADSELSQGSDGIILAKVLCILEVTRQILGDVINVCQTVRILSAIMASRVYGQMRMWSLSLHQVVALQSDFWIQTLAL